MYRLLELAQCLAWRRLPYWQRRAARKAADRAARQAQLELESESESAPHGFSASTLELQRIETQAERTIVQEIRLLERHVRKMLPSLQGDDLAYAHGLLLKLDRLASEQQADGTMPSQNHGSSAATDWLKQLAA